jgi:MoaA/NifB/PqqE/SkfB family radical SAM enzyme
MKKMPAYWNVLKLRVNIALKRKYVRNYPVQAYIEPTLFCNLRCPACPTGLQLGLRPSATIKWDLFKSTIDEIGDYVFSLFMCNWGEPLLHKQTPEMIRYAKDKEINILLSSNLSLPLTDDYIDRLVQSGLDTLIVSLDGTTAEAYSKYRLRGDFELVRKNMRRIQEAKKRLGVETPKLVWQFLVFKHNETQIGQALAEFREWGADEIVTEGAIMPFAPHDEGFEPSTLPEFNMYHPDHYTHKLTDIHDKSGRPCSWLYGIFVLNPNGKVSPCCASAGEETDFGDYTAKGGFFGVWNNATYKRARSLFTASSGEASPPSPPAFEAPANNLVQIERVTTSAAVATNLLHEEEAELIAGMGSNISKSLKQDELICQKCPIPYRQDEVDKIIAAEVAGLMKSFKSEKSLGKKVHVVLAYLLMGAPQWTDIAQAKLRKMGASLSPSFDRR